MEAPRSAMDLLNAVTDFALSNPHPDVARFHDSIIHWGCEWLDLEACLLPATHNLNRGIATALPETRGLIELFDRYKDHLRWEQTYSKQDAHISDAMLADYGYAEIIGSQGPFLSQRIRAGVGIYGANITYPRHRHQAEEIYIPLSGSARYQLGEDKEVRRGPGDVIYVKSNTPHEFSTDDEALIVYYLWQAGDLRQVSDFD